MEINYLPIERPEPAEDIRMEAMRLFGFIRRQAGLVLLFTLAACLIALLLLENTIPTYRSQVRLLFSQSPTGVAQPQSPDDALRNADEFIATQIALIESRSIAARVMNDLDLERRTSTLYGGSDIISYLRTLSGGLVGVLDQVDSAAETDGSSLVVDDTQARIIDFLQSNLTVFRVADSYVIEIGFDTADPALSREIADAYGQAFLADQLEARLEGLNRISLWLEARIEEIGQQSLEAAQAVDRYRVENNLVAADGRLVTDQQLTGLSAQLINARASVAAAQARVEIYDAAIGENNIDTLLSLPGLQEGAQDAEGSSLREDYLLAVERERGVIERWGAQNEQARAITLERERLASLLRADAARALSGFRSELARAQSELAAVTANFDTATLASEGASSTLVTLRNLEQRAQSFEVLYQNYLSRYQETVQQQSLPIDTARIITSAVLPDAPLFPNKKIAIALSLVLGAGLGGAVGIAREFFDRSLRTPADVEASGLPFLGYVPHNVRRGGTASRARRPSRWSRSRHARSAEDVLDATMQRLILSADPARVGPLVLAVSAIDDRDENGSFPVATALAEQLAALGHHVLLIAETTFDAARPASAPGLPVEASASAGAARNAKDKVANLTILPTHRFARASTASERAEPREIGRDVASFRERFDRIVIAGASLGEPLQLASLVPFVDSVVIVARWGEVPRQPIAETLRMIPGLRSRCVGALLAGAKLSKLSRYDRSYR